MNVVLVRIASLVVGSLLYACSGGSQTAGERTNAAPGAEVVPAVIPSALPTIAPPHPASTGAKQPTPVSFTYTLPTRGTASLAQARQTRLRRMQSSSYTGYTSTASAVTLNLSVTPVGGSATNYPANACTVNATGTSGTCAVAFSAPSGPTMISGTLLESGNTVAQFSNLVIIQPSTINSINFTANPVVNSVSVTLAASAVNAGAASDTLVAVNAKDANGNIISGNAPYVDVNGNPVSLSLSVANNQAGGRGSVTLRGPLRLSAPNQAPIYAHYDGNWLQSSFITVAAGGGTVTTLTGATLTTTPRIIEYPGLSSPGRLEELTVGSDGAIWFAEQSANKIGRMTTSGVLSEYSAGLSASAGPNSTALGPDGNVWFTEANVDKIGKITPAGVITEYSAGITSGSAPADIAPGPDGAMWFSENSSGRVGRITINGLATEYSAGITNAGPRGLMTGPDGNIWMAQGFDKLDKISPTGKVLFELSSVGGQSIVTGPDGNIWCASYQSNAVFKVTPNGTVTPYAISGRPVGITVGSDKNFYVTEQSGNNIDQVTTSGGVTKFNSGLSANAQPYGIIQGPDGNLWFIEVNKNAIGKFVL